MIGSLLPRSIFDFDSKSKKLEELNSLISEKNFWTTNIQAKTITKEAASLEKTITLLKSLENESNDLNAVSYTHLTLPTKA